MFIAGKKNWNRNTITLKIYLILMLLRTFSYSKSATVDPFFAAHNLIWGFFVFFASNIFILTKASFFLCVNNQYLFEEKDVLAGLILCITLSFCCYEFHACAEVEL
jgi:hypothetical protein